MKEQTIPSHKSILRPRRPRYITPLPIELTRRIPPEIIGLIVEKLDFDIPTLAVCCLVCKSWLSLSRPLLCPRVSLDRRNWQDFFDLVDSPCSTFSQGIKCISIQYASTAISHRSYHGKMVVPPAVPSDHPSPFNTVPQRLSGFSSLTSLCFSWVEYDPAEVNKDTTPLLWNLPSLTDLEFRTCSFGSFSVLANIICSLQNLRRITLSDVEWLETGSPPGSGHVLPPHLQKLELYVAHVSHILDWLIPVDGSVLSSIETVRLGSAFWEEVDKVSIGRFLRRLGSALRHVTLPWYLLKTHVDLSHNVRLHSISINHLSLAHADEQWAIAHGVPIALSQLNSNQLIAIAFKMLHHPGNPNVVIDWEKIARLLSRPCFGKLQMITIGVPVLDAKFQALMREVRGGRDVVIGARRSHRHHRPIMWIT